MAGKGKFSLEAIFSATDKLSAPLARIQTKLGAFGKSAKGALQSANSAVDKGLAGISKFSNVLGIGAVASLAGVVFELKNVITHGAEFESTLIRAGSAFDTPVKKGTAGFKELTDAARAVGRTTEFSAQQAAGGLNSLATAGFTAKQSISALPKIIDFASAGSLELGTAADIASDTLGAFGLRSADAAQNALNMGRAMDVMVRAAADSTTNVTELFEGIKMGGALAATSGVKIEEFTGLLGVLANAGLKGSEAGTAIRNSILRLTNATPEATRTMKQLGIQVARSKDGSIDMTATIGRFAKATSKLTKAQKSQAIANVFGAYTVGPFLNLMNAGEDTIRDFTKNLQNATGVTKTMADTMREGTANKIQRFFNILEDVRLGVFEAISGTVLEIAGSIGDWVTANQDLINTKAAEWCTTLKDALPDIWKYTVLIAKALAGFLVLAAVVKTISAIVTVAGWLGTAFTALSAGASFLIPLLAALGWPIVLFGVAVAAVVALVWAFWPEISSFFTRVAAWAVDAFGRMWAWIKTAFASAKTFLVGVFEFVVGLLSMLFAPQIATAKSFVGVLVGLFNSAVGVIQGAWGPVSDFFARMWGGIVTAATSFYGLLTQVWAPIGDFFSRLWGGIVDSFMGIVGPILDRAMKVIDAVRSVGRTALGTETPAAAPAAPPEIINPGTRAASEAAAAGTGASGTVDGTIVVKAEKGTSAQVKAQPRSAPIVLQPSGAFP